MSQEKTHLSNKSKKNYDTIRFEVLKNRNVCVEVLFSQESSLY